MKVIYFFTKKKRWALEDKLREEVKREVKRQVQNELLYYKSNLAPAKIELDVKDFKINVNVALFIVRQARKKFKECWHIEDALNIILNAFKGIPVVAALDLLLGKIAAVVDMPNNSIVLVPIEDHSEFELGNDIKIELDSSKVVSLDSFIKYLKLQR
jgi:hypothetical protein